MHSEGILSGELKHGPLALIDDTMPVMMIVVKDHTYEKCLNAVQQVTARNVSHLKLSFETLQLFAFQGKPVFICEEDLTKDLSRFGDKILSIPPIVDCLKGILTVIPLQLMSFHLATLKGLNVSHFVRSTI